MKDRCQTRNSCKFCFNGGGMDQRKQSVVINALSHSTSNISQWSVGLLRLHVAKWMLFSYCLYYLYPILLAQQWRRNSKRHPPLIRKEIDLIYLDSFKYCFSLFLYDRKVLAYCHFLLHTFLRHVARIIFSMNSLDGSIVPDQHIVVLNVLEYIITWMTLRFLFQIHITSLKVNYVF